MMKKTNPMLLIDFYKAVHAEMLPKGITKSVSYYTPRSTRVKRWDKVVMFGLQAFIKEYLIEYFESEFFNKPFEEVVKEYERVMDNALVGKNAYNIQKIKNLHTLGYLPIEIVALEEGESVPMGVPMFGITNTHDMFAWLPQSLESLISAESWHPMIAATVGKTYREIVNKYFDLTCDDNVDKSKALGAFDFRGEESLASAVKAGAGWCLSFANTATVPVVPYLENFYNCNCEKEVVAYGSPSTEHAVMCSNFAVDGDEETLLKRLLTEIYPDTSFSCVLDSYDYWNVVNNMLPKLKKEILAHNGCMLVRGDSGDCVDVVTKTVFKLWDHFGGTINSKGYKVLDPHVKAIYGDSITIQRCEEIYEILKENGFACSNVALGVGSFSFQCIEEDEEVEITTKNGEKIIGTTTILKPFTRDTFNSCIKATYCEINEKSYPIFKNPKDGGFKKSQKGCCVVKYNNAERKIYFEDGFTWKEACEDKDNMLKTVFKNGKMIKDFTLEEIREKLNGGKF